VIRASSPAVRHAVVEAIEICGNALFRHTLRIAEEYERKTGIRLVYWGQHHLDRETGHAIELPLDSLDLAPMTDDEVHLAINLVIEEQNSAMLLQTVTARSRHGFATRSMCDVPDIQPPARRAEEATEIDYLPVRPSSRQRRLASQLDDLRARLAEHPLLRDLREISKPDDVVDLLRLALISFATDSTGTATVYSSMISYRWPINDAERAINRLCSQFGRRTHFVYVDWHQLDLDRTLGWDFAQTLDFIYLHRYTEPYRDLRAVITHYVDRYESPVVRYWVIVALKSLSAVYAGAFCSLARSAEQSLGLHLPYLGLWANLQPVCVPNDPAAARVRFEELDISDEETRIIEQMMCEVTLGIEARLEGMRGMSLTDVMAIEPVH
jgi:hypothetical protein